MIVATTSPSLFSFYKMSVEASQRQVWFITGCSKGFGFNLVRELLTRKNFDVAATTRSTETLLSELKDIDTSRLLPLCVDLRNEESIQKGVDEAVKKFGRIDVLVNNAGFGLSGCHEEFSSAEFRSLFEINVFSVHSVTRIVLPYLRKQNYGCILNIASIGAQSPRAGNGVYGATKAAVVAMTEALADEVAPFNIKVCAVCPGPYRTNFQNNFQFVNAKIDCYQNVHQAMDDFVKSQWPGDPIRAIPVIIELAHLQDLPKVFFLGEMACKRAQVKFDESLQSVKKYEELSLKA